MSAPPASTNSYPPDRQTPGVFHSTIGDILVTVLNDGEVPGDVVMLDGVGRGAEAAVPRPRRNRISVNAFAVHSAGRLGLIDAGGNQLRATTGLLLDNMKYTGLCPGDFDVVMLTHMHPDHVGWLIDQEGKALFPRSRILMAEAEFEFWRDDRNKSRVVERALPWFDQNLAVIEAYTTRIETFDSGEVFPGVTTVDLAGHTPGHTGYEVRSAGDAAIFWGVLVQNQDLQMRFPEARTAWDTDPEQAVRSRIDLFAKLSLDGAPVVAGPHLHFPSFFTVRRSDIGYRLDWEPWAPYLR